MYVHVQTYMLCQHVDFQLFLVNCRECTRSSVLWDALTWSWSSQPSISSRTTRCVVCHKVTGHCKPLNAVHCSLLDTSFIKQDLHLNIVCTVNPATPDSWETRYLYRPDLKPQSQILLHSIVYIWYLCNRDTTIFMDQTITWGSSVFLGSVIVHVLRTMYLRYSTICPSNVLTLFINLNSLSQSFWHGAAIFIVNKWCPVHVFLLYQYFLSICGHITYNLSNSISALPRLPCVWCVNLTMHTYVCVWGWSSCTSIHNYMCCITLGQYVDVSFAIHIPATGSIIKFNILKYSIHTPTYV